jgi:hypothetical protein
VETSKACAWAVQSRLTRVAICKRGNKSIRFGY